jgi:hypothetical protein
LTIELSSKFDFGHQTQKPKIFDKFIFVDLVDLKVVLGLLAGMGNVAVAPHVMSLLFLFLPFPTSLSSSSTSHHYRLLLVNFARTR